MKTYNKFINEKINLINENIQKIDIDLILQWIKLIEVEEEDNLSLGSLRTLKKIKDELNKGKTESNPNKMVDFLGKPCEKCGEGIYKQISSEYGGIVKCPKCNYSDYRFREEE